MNGDHIYLNATYICFIYDYVINHKRKIVTHLFSGWQNCIWVVSILVFVVPVILAGIQIERDIFLWRIAGVCRVENNIHSSCEPFNTVFLQISQAIKSLLSHGIDIWPRILTIIYVIMIRIFVFQSLLFFGFLCYPRRILMYFVAFR